MSLFNYFKEDQSSWLACCEAPYYAGLKNEKARTDLIHFLGNFKASFNQDLKLFHT